MILNMCESIDLFLVRILEVDDLEGLEDVGGQLVDELAGQVELLAVLGLDRQVEDFQLDVAAVVPPLFALHVWSGPP